LRRSSFGLYGQEEEPEISFLRLSPMANPRLAGCLLSVRRGILEVHQQEILMAATTEVEVRRRAVPVQSAPAPALALIVAGSGGAWPRLRRPHRTLSSH
jgi:hypothetical protein